MTVKAMKAGARISSPSRCSAKCCSRAGNALAEECVGAAGAAEGGKCAPALRDADRARDARSSSASSRGRLNKVIGDELGVAERTVKAYRANVMEKMEAESIAELVQIAGLLQAAGAIPAPKDDRRRRDLPP